MTIVVGQARESIRVEDVKGDGAYLPLSKVQARHGVDAWSCLVLEADPSLDEREGEVVTRTSSWLLDWTKELGSGPAGDSACHARRAKRQAAFEADRKTRKDGGPF